MLVANSGWSIVFLDISNCKPARLLLDAGGYSVYYLFMTSFANCKPIGYYPLALNYGRGDF